MGEFLIINRVLFFSISVFSLAIGLLVLFSNWRSRINRLFFLITIIAFLWILCTFFIFSTDSLSTGLFFYRLNFGIIILFIMCGYFFIDNFPIEQKKYSKLNIFIIILSVVYFFITVFTDLIIKNVQQQEWGIDSILGKGITVYYAFIVLLISIIIVRLFKKYLKISSLEKLKINYFLVGILFLAIMNFIFNILIPWFSGSYRFYPLGDYSIIFFLGFTAYAIVKRELFGIRVVLTTVLVAVIAILLGLDIAVFTTDLLIRLYKGLVLLIFVYFGYLLIRSVLREIKMREQIARAYEIEKAARTEIEKLTEAKTQFIMATQHHLRTPLTQMIGYLDLVFGGTYGRFPEKIREVLDKLRISTKRLIRVVNELLDISQFQMGKEVVSLQPGIAIEPILKEVKEELYFELKARNLYFKIQKSGPVPKIKADSEKLKVALFNIIDNAIKYTHKGGITINLKAVNSLPTGGLSKGDKLRIIVKDTGIGIEPEQAQKLFKVAFERGKEAEKVHGFGRGIGVYITGHIIRAHKGKIWAESKGKDKGSTFYIELPVG